MIDQYFGIKELYEVVLKAAQPMTFGARQLEIGEPVLYFENINMSMLTEQNSPIMARGGWGNMPRVIWEDRSEVQFSLTEGIMSSISMGILLSANVSQASPGSLEIQKREGPYELDNDNCLYLKHWPIEYPKKKTFIYEFNRDVAQKKVYGKRITNRLDPFQPNKMRPCLQVYEDKELTTLADPNKEYIVDYYFTYDNDALVYLIHKERFNGLFTLEGKFYSKDENDGLNYTNIIYMPKVRVVSDISLRLGERADPTVSTFHIIGLPASTVESNNLIVKVIRLNSDIDGEI